MPNIHRSKDWKCRYCGGKTYMKDAQGVGGMPGHPIINVYRVCYKCHRPDTRKRYVSTRRAPRGYWG